MSTVMLCGKFASEPSAGSDNGSCPLHHIKLEQHYGIMSPYGIGTYNYRVVGVEWRGSCPAIFDFVEDKENTEPEPVKE